MLECFSSFNSLSYRYKCMCVRARVRERARVCVEDMFPQYFYCSCAAETVKTPFI